MAYNISVKFKDFPDRWRWVRARHRTAARRRPALQPGRRFDLPRAGVVLSAQNGPKPRRREHVLQTAVGRGNDAVFRPERNEFRRVDPSANRRGPDQCAQCSAKNTRLIRCSRKKWTTNTARSTGGCRKRTRFTGPRLVWTRRRKIPDKVKPDDLITLRRIIYQSMLQAFHHGRLIANPFNHIV